MAGVRPGCAQICRYLDSLAVIDGAPEAVERGYGVFEIVERLLFRALRLPARRLAHGAVRVFLLQPRGVEHDDVKIGMPVSATFLDFPDSDVSPAWSLYAWEAAK